MSRRVDPPYTRLFRGEDFDLTEFTLVLNEKKTNKKKQSTTKHNTEIEVKGSDSLLTLFSRGPASAIVCCLITFAAVFLSILKKGDTWEMNKVITNNPPMRP